MSTNCHVYKLSFLWSCNVYKLSCLWYVMSINCFVCELSCLWNLMSMSCWVFQFSKFLPMISMKYSNILIITFIPLFQIIPCSWNFQSSAYMASRDYTCKLKPFIVHQHSNIDPWSEWSEWSEWSDDGLLLKSFLYIKLW